METEREKPSRTGEDEKKDGLEGLTGEKDHSSELMPGGVLGDTNGGRIQALDAAILRMLQEAKDRFNAEGRCVPQAYIIQPDGRMCHCEGAAENFDAERFAERLERKVAEVHGVGVLSFGETWMVVGWDGVARVSEHPDRYEALAATIEAGDNAWLYIWPICRDASGIPRAGELRPAIPCETGLFRLRTFAAMTSP